ncbi:MAG TPA: shikimate kinase [Ignavibacteria bacterium]|jgi:shikimate kinase
MKIVLIGFRATGKSTVGKKLSKLLKYKYISIDEEIKKKCNLSISDIVSNYGWKYFRKIESDVIKECSTLDKIILDTGGGSILTKKNRLLLKKNSYIVQLTAFKKDIVERIKKGNDRPNLTSLKSLNLEVGELLKKRKVLYDSITDLKINTSKYDINTVLDKIIESFKGKL